jgi:hypothetical protein
MCFPAEKAYSRRAEAASSWKRVPRFQIFSTVACLDRAVQIALKIRGAAMPAAKLAAGVFAVLAATAAPALADDARSPPGGYTLFQPTPDDQLQPLCTDRPGKGTSACTVDPGHVQIEVDAYDAAFDRVGTLDTATVIYASSLIKLGLDPKTDIEVTLTPALSQRSHDIVSGVTTGTTGFGDTLFHVKYLLQGGSGPWAIALDPYVKAPTAAADLGNGHVEGGLVVPVSYALDDVWSVSMTPEVDVQRDSTGSGYHPNFANVVAVARTLGPVVFSGEVWGDWNCDRGGTTEQYTFDVDAAWQPDFLHDFQLDGGIDLPLNGNAPDMQVYIGVSKRV